MENGLLIPDTEQETISLRVPKDFGNIRNVSDMDPYQPWLVEKVIGYDDFENPIYETVGGFETFNESLLALVMINIIEKSNKRRSKKIKWEKEYLESKVDEMIRRAERRNIIPSSVGETIDAPSVYVSYENISPPIKALPPSNLNSNNGNSLFNPAIDYNNPLMKLTVREVYERWYKDKQLEDITEHTMDGYRNSFKKIEHLADRPFVELRFSEIEDCVRREKEKGNSYSMRKRVKLFFSQLYQWAISHEMCTSNMALNIKLGKNESDARRKPFSLKQIATLFNHVDEDPFIETVLMLIFTGCRIREFLNVKREDIHMNDRYFIVTESKTKAGRNRMVPIHKKMMKYFRKRLRAKSDYLIHDARGRKVEYSEYSTKFRNLMKRFEWDGMSPHCCRHTCASLLYSAGAETQTIKRILGHVQGSEVTERVYIHIQLADLHKAIDLI